jgi:hypothetical protein
MDPLARFMNGKIVGSKSAVMPQSGPMTLAGQPHL